MLSIQIDDAYVQKLRVILQNFLRKNSLYSTLPFDTDMFDQNINEHMNTVNKRLNLKNINKFTGNLVERKRAACGNLNGKT